MKDEKPKRVKIVGYHAKPVEVAEEIKFEDVGIHGMDCSSFRVAVTAHGNEDKLDDIAQLMRGQVAVDVIVRLRCAR